MGDQDMLWMDPKDILYTQESISNRFQRNSSNIDVDASRVSEPTSSYSQAVKTAPDPTLKSLLKELNSGRKSVNQIPPIRALNHNGKWYGLDNRRLWVFKEFGQRILVVVVKDKREFIGKFTGDGETIRIRDDFDLSRKNLKIQSSESSTFLEAHVLKWTVQNIFSKSLYVNKVKQIPSTFSSVEQYVERFRWPLLQETRAQLQQGLEATDFSRLPHATVTLKEKGNHSSPFRRFVMHLKTAEWNDNSSLTVLDVRPFDVVLVTSLMPQTVHSLMSNEEQSILALIQGSAIGSNQGSSFRVKIYAPPSSNRHKILQNSRKKWHAFKIQNLATGLRISRALDMALDVAFVKGHGSSLMKDTFCCREEESSARFEQPYSAAGSASALPKPTDISNEIKRYCKLRKLNKSQAKAIQNVVCGLLCHEPPLVRLIQGPPGTGKTSMLISLISILGCLNIRTLVCAPTNIAICDIAEKFIRFFDEVSPTEEIQFSHCCQGLSSVKPLQMGDVLLVGSEDRLSLDGDSTLNNIFLESRAQSLLDVLFILDDYKSTVNMIVEFMTSALNEYEKYMSNFHSGKKGYHPLKLAQFCREKIQRLMPKLMDLCWTMSNHLPTKLLPPDKLHQIVQAATFARIFLEFAEMEFSEEEASKCYSHFKPKKAYDCPYQSVTPDGSVKDMFSVALFVDYRKRLVTILNSILDFISHLKISKNEQQLKKKCLENAHIVFSTVSSAGRPSIKDSGPFQVLVIDEASQLVEAETAIVTQMDGLRRAILVGDQKQLPATVFSELAKRCNYDRSLFERLVTLKHPHDLLNIQYRMHPAISSFPSRYFYDGQVKDGYYVTSQSCKELQQTLFGPYVFIDTRDGREEKDGGYDKSWRNPVEVHVVLSLLTRIHDACQMKTFCRPSIGVISPYKGQVLALENVLESCHSYMDIEVKTVDGFQGKEKDIIIFSTVRTNKGGNIGFLADQRRLNVAITRGRYCTWIVGHAMTLCSKNKLWKDLIDDAKTRKCFKQSRKANPH